ncbi:hypothetical protein [Amycolatopsis sp. cmx-4-54]|uniref:ATP dependent DNA ligase n=1 Tax=Amycolatopsis sp. cmx-4-54 TaxID=2790936 RepID=UPI003979D4B7
MGGLLLGAYDPDSRELRYIGDVGTGLSDAERARLHTHLETLTRPEHPFADDPPRADVDHAQWVDPVLVGEVVFRQVTRASGHLRHPAWRGLRNDKDPGDVLAPQLDREPVAASPPAAEPAAATRTRPRDADDPPRPLGPKITVQAGTRQLTLSNLDKPLYPHGFTKGEVINLPVAGDRGSNRFRRGRPTTFTLMVDNALHRNRNPR